MKLRFSIESKKTLKDSEKGKKDISFISEIPLSSCLQLEEGIVFYDWLIS